MPKINLRLKNKGAYDSPFSGVGVEFLPLEVKPGHSGIVLHETGFLQNNYWWNFSNVLSPFWRVMYNSSPGHAVIFNGKKIPLTPDHIMIIPTLQNFDCSGNTSASSFWIAFNTNYRLSPKTRIPIKIRPSDTELQLIDKLCKIITPRDSKNKRNIMHHSMALLHNILANDKLCWQEDEIHPGIQKAQDFIEKHFHESLNNESLADVANMSVGGFIRSFRQYTGFPPKSYLCHMRIREASARLVNSNKTIEMISDECGFPNRGYFSRIFKKITNEPPASFRTKYRQGSC